MKLFQNQKKFQITMKKYGALIFDVSGHYVLVIKERSFPLELRKWGIPKGTMVKKETPFQCIEREVYEEVGIDLKTIKYSLFHINPKLLTTEYIILSKDISEINIRIDRGEIKKAMWMKVEELTTFIKMHKNECNRFLRTCLPALEQVKSMEYTSFSQHHQQEGSPKSKNDDARFYKTREKDDARFYKTREKDDARFYKTREKDVLSSISWKSQQSSFERKVQTDKSDKSNGNIQKKQSDTEVWERGKFISREKGYKARQFNNTKRRRARRPLKATPKAVCV